MTEQIYHFIGIGGIGMSGLARILLAQGKAVSGSDIVASALTEELQKQGATIYVGHDRAQVPKNSTVVYSSDIVRTNAEMLAAHEWNCSLLHRSDLLASLMQKNVCLL